jgi:hypothetical protein
VAYVGADGVEAAQADLAQVDDLDRSLAEGAVCILPVEDVYGPGGPVDAERTVSFYAAATEQALADGFRGLRVGADSTALVRTSEQQDAFVGYELLLGRYMADHPLSALCGYDFGLGDEIVGEFASLHTADPSDESAFRIFSCADGALGLAGEFDPVSVRVLNRVLSRLRTGADTRALVDMAGIEYLDHRLLLTLSTYAQAKDASLLLRSAPPFAARLIELLPTLNLRLAEREAQS